MVHTYRLGKFQLVLGDGKDENPPLHYEKWTFPRQTPRPRR